MHPSPNETTIIIIQKPALHNEEAETFGIEERSLGEVTFLISTNYFLAVYLYFFTFCALSSKLIQNGDAMKKVDNPPTMTPIDIGRAKSLICGTNIATDNMVKSVVSLSLIHI